PARSAATPPTAACERHDPHPRRPRRRPHRGGPTVILGTAGARTIDVPRLLRVERGALDHLADGLIEHFDVGRVVIATGGDVSRAHGERLAKAVEAVGGHAEVRAGLTGSLGDAARLLHYLDESPASLVVGIGGGQPIDVAKLAACRARVDLVA